MHLQEEIVKEIESCNNFMKNVNKSKLKHYHLHKLLQLQQLKDQPLK